MADAEKLEADAKKAEDKVAKPLPALVSPMTRLSPEIRQEVAKFCREQNASFSPLTNQMWIDKLKSLGKIAKDFVPAPTRLASEGLRAKVSAAEKKAGEDASRITELEAQLAALKTKK